VKRLDAHTYVDGVRGGDRAILARAITLVESEQPAHAELAQKVLESLLPETGGACRVGISGVPGAGKSTFIDALGTILTDRGHRVAVLAVDPTSTISGGSILGDKTRMEDLARSDRAFIRPSPAGATLGGVAHRTREVILLCESAGFDVVLVETVGIGQSEVAVRSMVDFFLVLLQPGAGDELQGIKKGVLELADCLVVNKADGDQKTAADHTQANHISALGLLRSSSAWKPPVLKVSALHSQGIDEVWQTVQDFRALSEESGEFAERRRHQAEAWLWTLVEEGLQREFRAHPEVSKRIGSVVDSVERLETSPAAAANELLEAFRKN